jgi:hypothetical protein
MKNNISKFRNINEANLVVVVMCSIRQSAVDRVEGLAKKFAEKLHLTQNCVMHSKQDSG